MDVQRPPQIIDGQYLDQQKLMHLLKIVYGTSTQGENRFRVEVRSPFRYPLMSMVSDPISFHS